MCTQPRSAWVYSDGVLVPYPFQANLYGLPVPVVKACVLGAVRAQLAPAERPPANVEEWMLRTFGEGITDHFMRPYNEKVWAFPLSEMVPTWTGERVVRPDLEQIIGGALERSELRDYPNARVTYPARGGFSSLYAGFLPHVRANLRRDEVVAVDLARREVETASGERVHYQHLVSTMPLTRLVERTADATGELLAAAARLVHNSLALVSLVFGRPCPTDMQRVYVADPCIPFHKAVVNSNSSPWLRERGVFGVQAEVTFSRHKPVRTGDLVERVLDGLRAIGLVEPDEEPIANDLRVVEMAYPVATHGWTEARQRIVDVYRAHDVHCAGRFAEWRYINSDEAVRRGMQVAEALNGAPVG